MNEWVKQNSVGYVPIFSKVLHKYVDNWMKGSNQAKGENQFSLYSNLRAYRPIHSAIGFLNNILIIKGKRTSSQEGFNELKNMSPILLMT